MVESNRVDNRPRPADQPERSLNSERRKNESSPFDRVLQQSVSISRQPQFQQEAGRQADRQWKTPRKREEREVRQERTRDMSEDEVHTEQDRNSEADRSEEVVKQRVVVKAPKGRGGKQRGKGQGDSSSGYGGYQPGAGFLRADKSKKYASIKSDMGTAVATKFKEMMDARKNVPTKLDQTQLQQLVNLMVQSVRVGKNAAGEDELQMIFQESVFKGLRLRLQSRNGKVAVSFSSDHAGVRSLFRRERERIMTALRDNGVEVEFIEVN